MAVSDNYLQLVQDQLKGLGEFESKRMFGGVGLFKDGLMFGKIGSDILYLKVDDSNKADFEKYGMAPFYSEKKKKGMPYWQVPAEIIEDAEALVQWAKKSHGIAVKLAK